MRRLLDLLPKIGEKETFTTFVRILQVDYDWIADRLCECNNRDSPDASCHSNNDPFASVDSLLSLQHSLIQAGIPFPPPHLIPRRAKVSFLSFDFSKKKCTHRTMKHVNLLFNKSTGRPDQRLS